MSTDGLKYTVQMALKRGFDLLVTLFAIVFLSPLIALIVLAIKLDSKGPAIYRHRRVGKDGVPFDLYKFRSMVSGGDDTGYMNYLKELIESEQNENGNALPYRKLQVDPRVTRVGRFLRTYYLDELPQIVNILVGDMSIVGPRPHVQFEVDHYTPEQRRRLMARPGATGLWQVTGKADCSFNELIELDLAYIDNWSIWLDIKIILMTASLMIKGGEGFWARMAKQIPNRPAKSYRARGQALTPNQAASLPADSDEEITLAAN